MNLGVRMRVGIWLLFVALVVGTSGLIVLDATRDRLETSSQDTLMQLAELESDRLVGGVDVQRVAIEQTAITSGVVRSLTSNFGVIIAERELNNAIENAQVGGLRLRSLRLVDRDGTLIGRTDGADWDPETLALESMDRRAVLVGPAVTADTVGFVAPVVTEEGEVLGALIVESELEPILRLSNRYESFGETSEAFVYERLTDGTCRLLTNLRFARAAAFTPLTGEYADNCNDITGGQLLDAIDYRGAETISAWSEVPGTQWGVVVKMDDAEVFALLNQVQRTVLLAGLIAGVLLIGGWIGLVRPIGTRLFKTAKAAERLAAGNYKALINDPRTDEIGRVSESLDSLAMDLTRDIKRREVAEAQLRVRADYDNLTGLMNRHRTNDRMKDFASSGQDFTVVFLDLDGFKEINDTYGHSIGDEVLRLVAARCQDAIDSSAISGELGRWGGDEFVVLCVGRLEAETTAFIELIDSYFDQPFVTEAGQHRVGVSIGSADSSDGATPEAVMSAADDSMYSVKRLRDGRTRVSPQAIQFVESALEDDRIFAYLQPLVSVDEDGGVHLFGAEALVRIENKDGSFERPDSFLPGLGSSRQALDLDLRVLERAATVVGEWHRSNLVPPDFYVSVNLGGAAMVDPRLVDKISDTIAQAGMSPQHLVVEVPETAEDVNAELINEIRERGIRIAIDDVGCQFSNLGRLVDIPADIAKIDRRWLPDNAGEENNKLALLNALTQQCTMLDLTVIVEGVETDLQLEVVRSLGVNRVQGYLFGKPVAPCHFERLWGRPGGESIRVLYSNEDEDTVPEQRAA